MDPLRGLPLVPGAIDVHERRGGQRQADAFRRAMQQGEQGSDRPADGGGQAPMRRPLQPAAPAGRKNEHPARHVDVIA